MKIARFLFMMLFANLALTSAFAFDVNRDPQLTSLDPYANYNIADETSSQANHAATRGHIYLQAGAGFSLIKLGQNQTIQTNAFNSDTYQADNKSLFASTLKLGFGYRWRFGNNWQVGTGVAFYDFASQTLRGDVLTAGEETGTTYQFDVAEQALFSEFNVVYSPPHAYLVPYFSLDLGISRNTAESYSYQGNGWISPAFAKQSKSHFAYGLGAGLRWLALSQLSIDLSYHYFNLGDISLADDPAYGSIVAPGLSSGKITPQVFILALDYQF